jgi:threonine/homoserine/homoserine lactone efflux protein
MAKRRGLNAAQTARAENAGVLTASGLIAGEAICGLLWAGVIALSFAEQPWLHAAAGLAARIKAAQIFAHPAYLAGIVVMALLAGLMIFLPLSSAGDPNEPAPPTAMM